MSFGYSAGDFVLCAQLAHKVWRECRDAPEDFRAVSTEVASLQLVLREMQDAVHDREISLAKQQDLKQLLAACTGVLQELEELMTKYKSLGTQSKRTWDRLRWSKDHVESVRLRVISNNSLLTSFNVGLLGAGQARIEKLLEQLVAEHQSGLREESLISNHTIESAEDGDEAAWCQIGRELEDVGITSTLMQENRAFIITWIKSALASGQLDERAYLPEMDSTVSSREESSSQPNEDLNIPAKHDPNKQFFVPCYGLSPALVEAYLGPLVSVRPYTYEGHEGSLVTSSTRWTQSQLEDLQEICGHCELQPPKPSKKTEGYFVFAAAISLKIIQAYLGPHTSVQSFAYRGFEGSLVASPDHWTKSRIEALQELCRHCDLQAPERVVFPTPDHASATASNPPSDLMYKYERRRGYVAPRVPFPIYQGSVPKDIEITWTEQHNMSPSTEKTIYHNKFFR